MGIPIEQPTNEYATKVGDFVRISTEPTHALFRDREVQKSILVFREQKRDSTLGYDNFCADAVVAQRHANNTFTVLFLESFHKWQCGAEILQTTERGMNQNLVQHLVGTPTWTRFCTVVAIHPRVDRRALATHFTECHQQAEDLCDAYQALECMRGLFRLRQFLQGETLDPAMLTGRLASVSAAKASLDARLETLG